MGLVYGVWSLYTLLWDLMRVTSQDLSVLICVMSDCFETISLNIQCLSS